MGLRKRRGVEEAIVLKFWVVVDCLGKHMKSHLSRSKSR